MRRRVARALLSGAVPGAMALVVFVCRPAVAATHVWEKIELTFVSQQPYANPYTDVEMWVQLTGPGFDKRIDGFWDGQNVFRVRIMATRPGV